MTANQPGYSFAGIDRAGPLGWYTLAFVVVVALVARLRGLLALVGLGVSAWVIARFMLPALLTGEPGVAVAIVTASAIMYVVLYLAHGLSIRTSTALAGTLGGILMTAALAQGAVRTSHLSGVSDETGQLLTGFVGGLDFPALLTGAIIIAGLGVLNDVTITQSSAVWELRAAAPDLTRMELFRSAMRIGRDHIASTIYTIVFAYAGAALSVLLLLYLYKLAPAGPAWAPRTSPPRWHERCAARSVSSSPFPSPPPSQPPRSARPGPWPPASRSTP